MSKILIETYIKAPIERCFDLSRSVDLHLMSAAETNELAVAGVTRGLLGPGDNVTWEARHFGVIQRLSVQITAYDRPKFFRDSQTKGIFRRFDHDHFFETKGDGTLIREIFDFDCPMGTLGKLVADYFVARHLRKFLIKRNEIIKKVAESDEWRSIL